jgi:ubiquinone/menaquinone biosynthesis C-methylase UbiE
MLGISRRFDKFTDMLDAFVGRGKGLGNEKLNAWTVSLLHVQPEDRILEIGCGPGVGIQHAARLVQQGWIAGVDISLDMVQKARRRNLAAIHNGRVELLEGDIARLPYIDNTFDKAFSVNCVPFWPRVIDNLREVHRVLRPGGMVAVTLQPWWTEREAEVARQCVRLLLQMVEAGFQQLHSEPKTMRPLPAFCVLGIKEPLSA